MSNNLKETCSDNPHSSKSINIANDNNGQTETAEESTK